MKKNKLYSISVLVLAVLGIYNIWSETDRNIPERPLRERSLEIIEIGHRNPETKGNLLAIQPWMELYDFTSAELFRAKLRSYLEEAESHNLISRPAVVVFPEFIGTWLVVLGEKESTVDQPDVHSAMRLIILSNLGKFLAALPFTKNSSIVEDAIFRMKSRKMARVYEEVFASLAREYKITLVAGSIVLPEPSVENGKIRIGNGLLYNAGFVFKEDGTVYNQVTRKVFPVKSERGFVASAPVDSIPVFKTDLGNLAVLICADSWYPQSYQVVKDKKADIVVVPSNLVGEGVWNLPWRGYEKNMTPEDVTIDPGTITEGEAWQRYALKSRLQDSSARTGINVFLEGQFWDMGCDGRTIGIHNNTVKQAQSQDGAVLLNIWL